MKPYNIKSECSGCGACCNACPKKCIEMKIDDDGFYYPFVREDDCINCEQCKKVCSCLEQEDKKLFDKSYAVVNKDADVLKKSSSGGVFYELALQIIQEKGVVVGAAFTNDYKKVEHIIIKEKNGLKKLQTSKYVQSIIGNTYTEIKKYLEKNIKVLFSGTPCQIYGLKNYLKKEYDSLFCVEVICHGIPSIKVWNKYLDYIEEKCNGKVEYYNFRSKINGWKNYKTEWKCNEKITRESNDDNAYMQFFLNNLSLRPSCFNCNAKEKGSMADIILGDFWGIDKVLSDVCYQNGVSAVVVNNEKGEKLFNATKENFEIFTVNYNDIVKYNPSIISSSNMPNKYNEFMRDLNNCDFANLIKKYKTKRSFIYYLKKVIKFLIKH